jgi:hypothetical protein
VEKKLLTKLVATRPPRGVTLALVPLVVSSRFLPEAATRQPLQWNRTRSSTRTPRKPRFFVSLHHSSHRRRAQADPANDATPPRSAGAASSFLPQTPLSYSSCADLDNCTQIRAERARLPSTIRPLFVLSSSSIASPEGCDGRSCRRSCLGWRLPFPVGKPCRPCLGWRLPFPVGKPCVLLSRRIAHPVAWNSLFLHPEPVDRKSRSLFFGFNQA